MSRKPNVLLIMTDQQALSTMQSYGETPCRTPNLDRLAARSTLFENHYTTCPLCSPARGTIMTGLYPHSHGVTANVAELGCAVSELPDGPQMLSRRLQAEGYQCGYTGKWHLGTNRRTSFGVENTPSLPKDLGFDGQNFPGHGGGGFGYPEYQEYLKKRGLEHAVTPSHRLPFRGSGELAGPEESTVPHFLAEHTMSLMDQYVEQGSPFFIWHNFWGPHEPYYATKQYLDLYADVDIPPWPNFSWRGDFPGPYQVKAHPHADTLDWSDWEDGIKHYYAFMTMIDHQVGRMLGHLETLGIYDDTMIIFTPDHGETLGTHGGMIDKGYAHFEEIQHIPLLVKRPSGEAQVSQAAGFTSLADIYPTILEVAGAKVDPSSTQGRSLVPLTQGAVEGWRDYVVCEFHGLGNGLISMRTIRKGSLKYGFTLGGHDELYDLEQDPHETVNRVEDSHNSTALTDLRMSLLAWMEETNDPVRGLYQHNRRITS